MEVSRLWSGRVHASLLDGGCDSYCFRINNEDLGWMEKQSAADSRTRKSRGVRSCSVLHISPSCLVFTRSSWRPLTPALRSPGVHQSYFLPIAYLNPFATPAIARHYHGIMHAKPLPRKPRAMKQILAGLVRASFLIKHGEWTLCRMIRAR